MEEHGLEQRVHEVETDLRIFKEVFDTRLGFMESTVRAHMTKEEENITKIYDSIKDLAQKIVATDQMIERRILACRTEQDVIYKDKYATREDLATLRGDVKSNGKLLTMWIAGVGILISVVNVIINVMT